jgi:uncharacterized membrane protein
MFERARRGLRAHRFKILLAGLALIVFVRAFRGVDEEFGEGVTTVGLGLPLFALLVSTGTRYRRAIALLLAVGALASSAGVLSGSVSVRQSAALEVSLAFLLFTTVVVFATVFRSPRVTGDVLAGAIAGFVLLGLCWASVHALLESRHARSFTVVASGAPPTYDDLVYFSFVTLMTIGFGDIVPITEPARALVICQGITGVAFNTIVLALLVAKYLAHGEPSDA